MADILKTFSPELDTYFEGGIPTGRGIIEISGEAGTGKTQLTLQLALAAQDTRGFNSRVLIITTSKRTPVNRLSQLCNHFVANLEEDVLPASPLDNIFIEHCPTLELLITCILRKMQRFILQHNTRLIIIDSVAHLFRALFEHTYQAHQNKIFILVITINEISLDSPALGVFWTNCIDVRFRMKHKERQQIGGRRSIKLLKPILVPKPKIKYVIRDEGIVVMPD